MKIEIARHDRMSESGSSLLRLIQNQDMPLLDLLVRESIQNSLDAAKKDAKYVGVDFRTGTFDYRKLNSNFDRIENKLNSKFSRFKGNPVFIEVRDHNTVGLTGPTRYEDVKNNEFGNLMKLVYEISKPQQNEGSGGSWGLGKTIYFRFGIGLVIYYSRINDGKKYRSRLAACLVEDETKPGSIIPEDKSGVKRGIAWWGRYTGIGSEKHSVPIEDEKEINSILAIFGLKPFSGTQTGTSVIIPYIKSSERMNETYSKNEDVNEKPWWVSSIDNYLSVAIQRWYAPRIENSFYKGPYLSASVNDRKIEPDNMLPLFRAVRELYIKSISNDFEGKIVKSSSYYCEDICVRNVFSNKSVAGILAFAKCSNADLRMLPPDNERSPYQQITNKAILSDNGNTPIIMFTRKPGMIVGYDFNGTWTHKMPRSSDDEYIIGLFRLNSANAIRQEYSKSNKLLSLEEYIRKGEKADHASWADWIVDGNNLHIVQNIQKNVNNKITAKFKEAKVDQTEKKNIGLGQALAEILLPKSDFGKKAIIPSKSRSTGGSGSGGGVTRKNKCYFTIIGNPEYRSGNIKYMFEIGLPNNDCILDLNVITDFKKMSPEKWESDDEVGKPFPIRIEEVSVRAYKEGKSKEKECNIILDESHNTISDDIITIERINSALFGIPGSIRIHSKLSDVILTGSISINPSESCLKGGFEIKEEGHNG